MATRQGQRWLAIHTRLDKRIDDALERSGAFRAVAVSCVRSVLDGVDVECEPTEVLLAYLMGSFRNRAEIGEPWTSLLRRVEAKFHREHGDRTDKLLRGLKP